MASHCESHHNQEDLQSNASGGLSETDHRSFGSAFAEQRLIQMQGLEYTACESASNITYLHQQGFQLH